MQFLVRSIFPPRISVGSCKRYKGGDDGRMRPAFILCGIFYAAAAYMGGAVASAALNFLVQWSICAVFFRRTEEKAKAEKEKAKAEKKEKKEAQKKK